MKQITSFWNWFQNNETALKNALILGINTEEVFFHLNRNLRYVSKRIGFEIAIASDVSAKSTIIFTAYGYRKLFPKLIALQDEAPQLKHFIVQAFIKPLKNIENIQLKKDAPRRYENYQIKISELQIALLHYDIQNKRLKIKVFIPEYDKVNHFEDLDSNLDFIVMEILGEIAYRKHIKKIEYAQSPIPVNGLLDLIELPFLIDYLYKINSRGKTNTF